MLHSVPNEFIRFPCNTKIYVILLKIRVCGIFQTAHNKIDVLGSSFQKSDGFPRMNRCCVYVLHAIPES